MKRLSLLLAITCIGIGAFAQSSKVSSAINYLDNGELDRALESIEVATLNEKTANSAKTWLYRGRVYSAIGFDQSGNFTNLAVAPLDSALYSFNYALTLSDVDKYKKLLLLEYQNLQFGFFNMGAQAFQNKNYQLAHDAFAKSSEANLQQRGIDEKVPMDTGVIFNVGLTAERLGYEQEAMDIFQKLVDMGYNEPYVYQALSEIYNNLGRVEDAIAVINAGRKAFPTNQALIITELNFYLAQGKVEEIVNKLQEAINLDPDNVELYFALGNAYGELEKTAMIESGTPAESVKSCLGEPDSREDVTEKGASAQKWTYGKVEITMVDGKISDIEGDMKQLNEIAAKCDNPAKAKEYFGKAVDAYKKALELQPDNFENNLYLGALYYNTAIEINKKIINLPLDAEAEYNKLVEERNQLYADALPYFEKAHALNDKDVPTMQALKEIYAKQNNFEKMKEIKTKLGE
jgi:tetratricopeptide (TPR) repeat protein